MRDCPQADRRFQAKDEANAEEEEEVPGSPPPHQAWGQMGPCGVDSTGWMGYHSTSRGVGGQAVYCHFMGYISSSLSESVFGGILWVLLRR